MRADPDTFPAVNAELAVDLGFSSPNPNRFRWAPRNAVDAPCTQIRVQPHRMVKFIHYIITAIVILVPTPILVSTSMVSVYFFMLGSPIPAPKPKDLTSSGAVE